MEVTQEEEAPRERTELLAAPLSSPQSEKFLNTQPST